MSDIDHNSTESVVCPHCGHAHDYTDYGTDGVYHGTEDCEKCGKTFRWDADFSVSFSTSKIESEEVKP